MTGGRSRFEALPALSALPKLSRVASLFYGRPAGTRRRPRWGYLDRVNVFVIEQLSAAPRLLRRSEDGAETRVRLAAGVCPARRRQ